jgi:hypothetical protein
MISATSSITQRRSWLPRMGFLKGPAAALFRALIHEKEINGFLNGNSGLDGFAFIDRVLAGAASIACGTASARF